MKQYKIDGMTCGGCARSVDRAVRTAAPEAEPAVDLERGMLTLDGPHDPERVRDAVEAAGFDWGGPAPR